MHINYSLKTRAGGRRTEQFRPTDAIPFGKLRSDHMFLMDYADGEWSQARIVPYGSLHNLMPGAICLHYGQGIFEGLKAHKHPDGELYTFRADQNASRLNRSADIMCMPHVPEDAFLESIDALLDIDRLWYPEQEEASMYVRPCMIGTEDSIGVHPSAKYTFCLFLSPSGPYYPGGFTKPIDLLISKKFHRAAPGGTGSAKAAGNYGGSLRAGKFAENLHCKQVLYLDVYNEHVEEAGAMNHFHVTKDGKIVIPEFTDTILRSITAMSLLETEKGRVCQEPVPIQAFIDDVRDGRITEAGGCGTAAVITAVGSYHFDDCTPPLRIGNGEIGPVTREMYEKLTAIQTGRAEAPSGWLRKVQRRSPAHPLQVSVS